MLKGFRKYGGLLVALFAFISCEKTLHLELDAQPPVLVVDAWIEEGQPPIVVLTKSLDYFSKLDTDAFFKTFIRGAKITINDGTQSAVLNEYNATQSFISPFYSTDTNTVTPHVYTGVQGKKYTLTIEAGGKVYEAITHIPVHVKTIDSLWWKPLPKIADTPLVSVLVRVTDPPGLGNYIRYFISTNNKRLLPAEISVFDDQVVDGKTYDIPIGESIDWNRRDSVRGHRRGDTISIKFCNIDKASFDFWRTWETTMRSIGNPFASPGKVLGNISNGALGSFCGYSVQRKTVFIPK